jgi:hypothetical protein
LRKKSSRLRVQSCVAYLSEALSSRAATAASLDDHVPFQGAVAAALLSVAERVGGDGHEDGREGDEEGEAHGGE